jgi:hypothetical protein
MSPSADLSRVRAVAASLSLDEADLAAGDETANRIAAFKAEVDAVDAGLEPWLSEWLADEHFKAATLFAAAKVNLNHELLGKATAADRRMRATIILRFNGWVDEIQARLSDYERSGRTQANVSAWRSELARFRTDPVHNR